MVVFDFWYFSFAFVLSDFVLQNINFTQTLKNSLLRWSDKIQLCKLLDNFVRGREWVFLCWGSSVNGPNMIQNWYSVKKIWSKKNWIFIICYIHESLFLWNLNWLLVQMCFMMANIFIIIAKNSILEL